MTEHTVEFDIAKEPVHVPTGTLLVEAAEQAGIEIQQPCGGQGRCGRCIVRVASGDVRRRSTLRLSQQDVELGYALACQSVVESDSFVNIPEQDKLERRLTTDRMVAEVTVPLGYNPKNDQTLRRVTLTLPPPNMEDQTDDWSRVQIALRQEAGFLDVRTSIHLLRQLGDVLRAGDWKVTAILDTHAWDAPADPARLICVQPGHNPEDSPLWGAAVDIGTTTVTLWLVDLLSGEVRAQVAEYNRQISRGEDVISRIIYAGKNGGGQVLQELIVGTINELIVRACKQIRIDPSEICKLTFAGNSTMIHLLLNIPAETIRRSPFITTVNHVPAFHAREIGINANPEAAIDCLPGVASYVGADISAGVLSSGLDDTEQVSLFLDVGTNGETVMGTREWLVTCACSAGPAFEGAGVRYGMRATKGAIEEVWINSKNFEPTYRVIGNVRPEGICGSGLISLLAELFMTGALDKGGNFNTLLNTCRIRPGEHGAEYVVAWADETQHGQDIVITHVDIDNLLRAKAAIYAGFSVLANGVGVPLETVEKVLIGGAFGKYINIEKAIQIGLLPDLPWERFEFLGNTSVKGAYLALLDRKVRARIKGIAMRMTYIELSADNSFYEAFTSALFLPHTDMSQFPSIADALSQNSNIPEPVE